MHFTIHLPFPPCSLTCRLLIVHNRVLPVRNKSQSPPSAQDPPRLAPLAPTPPAPENTAPTCKEHVSPSDLPSHAKPTPDAAPGLPPPSPIAVAHPPHPHPIPAKSEARRSAMLKSRASSEKLSQSPETQSKRPGWISSLSSKFSSSSNGTPTLHAPKGLDAQVNGSTVAPPAAPATPSVPQASRKNAAEAVEDTRPYVPQAPKSGNFFSNTLRRLSTSTPAPAGKVVGTGGVCPRRTLNVDKDRERCELKDLHSSRLKRVAFRVDVEVAGFAQYADGEPEPSTGKGDKKKDMKIKEKSEGAALKNPQKFAEEKEKTGKVADEELAQGPTSDGVASAPLTEEQKVQQAADHAARAERAERRRMAGAVPMETSMDERPPPASSPDHASPLTPASGDRPTTDPVRMYRRCCQLREAPVLKRITEQLMNPQRCGLEKGGVVGTLDLRGSRMQVQDIICVGDWLSIVPVRKLLLDNANLTDEGLRHVLSGLLAAKPLDTITQKRGKSDPHQPRPTAIHRTPGIIEKLTLKNNPRITAEGWKHLFVFLNMSKSIRAIDVSLIPFAAVPKGSADAAPSSGGKPAQATPADHPSTEPADMAETFYRALKFRRGTQLKELTMGNCSLSTHDVEKIVDAALVCGIETLGLAQNRITIEGIKHVVRFMASKHCKGLDIGSNDMREAMPVLVDAIVQNIDSPLWGLSFADCNLNPHALAKLMPCLTRLPNFRFLDLSHNQELFSGEANALGTLRKFLPQLNYLRRLHLADTAMGPAHAIAIAEILPEIRNINHITFLDNPLLRDLIASEEVNAQEDTAALYASLMVAVRCSKTLLAIDIEAPGPSTNEVILALHKQLTAYTLRNLERYTATDAVNAHDPAAIIPDLKAEDEQIALPQVLVHLVGQPVKGAVDPEHDDEIGPDQDYVVGGTGVVKALSYCLGQRASDLKRGSLSGSATPVTPLTPTGQRNPWREQVQAKEMSRSLLDSARKIRERIQRALEGDCASGDDFHLRRLQFLDHTLTGIIARFEQEYPECRASDPLMTTTHASLPPPPPSMPSAEPVEHEVPLFLPPGSSIESGGATKDTSAFTTDGEPTDTGASDESFFPSMRMSRRGSNASIASKAMGVEEGQMHRLGQRVRRELMPPRGQADALHGTSTGDAPEEQHIADLRAQLEQLAGDELRERVVNQGLDATIRDWTGMANDYKRKSMSEYGLRASSP